MSVDCVGLCGIAYELGERSHDLSVPGCLADESVRQLLLSRGLRIFRSTGLDPAQLAAQAIARTLQICATAPSEIEAVVYGTGSFWSDELLPERAAGAQWSQEFSKRIIRCAVAGNGIENARCIGVFLTESGNLGNGIAVARSLILGEGLRKVIFVAADKLREQENRVVPAGVSIISDAAVACLVTAGQGEFTVRRITQRTRPVMSTFSTRDELKILIEVSRAVKVLAEQALQGSSPADYRRLITNNFAESTLSMLARQAGFSTDQLYYDNLARFGHAFAADPLINLCDLDRAGGLAGGDRVMLLPTGPMTWGMLDLVKS